MTHERIAELRRLHARILEHQGYLAQVEAQRDFVCSLLVDVDQLLDAAEACDKMRQAVVHLHEKATALAHVQRGKDDWVCGELEREASSYYRAIAAMDAALSPPQQAGAQK